MSAPKKQAYLAKLLAYILGRNPAEFGLVPDTQGFIRIKDLLKAICEEQGWRHIRRHHLEEVMLTSARPPIEINGDRVRAVDRAHLHRVTVSEKAAKQLYTCVRRKAYPTVLEKGVLPGAHPFVILSDNKKMAERLGLRSDATPVLLTVSVPLMKENGLRLQHAGGTLFLADRIPPDCFTGPAPVKTRDEKKPAAAVDRAPTPKTPGSFYIELTNETPHRPHKGQKNKGIEWKRARRQMNRDGKGKHKPEVY